jgi:hypothetical protein
VVGSLVGVTAFLVLLLFAVQLVLNLYATTVVTGVGFDAARIVAGAEGGPGAEASAEAFARGLLGRYEQEGSLRMDWSYGPVEGRSGAPATVHLRLRATHPTRLLPGVTFPFQVVDRTIHVRVEDLR